MNSKIKSLILFSSFFKQGLIAPSSLQMSFNLFSSSPQMRGGGRGRVLIKKMKIYSFS
jgi:hypothetical protein